MSDREPTALEPRGGDGQVTLRWMRFTVFPEQLRAEVRHPWSVLPWVFPLVVFPLGATAAMLIASLPGSFGVLHIMAVAFGVFGLAGLYNVVKSIVNGTMMSFAHGRFTAVYGPIARGGRISHPLSDIECFEIEPRDEASWNGPFSIVLVTSAGAKVEVPLATSTMGQGYFGPVTHVEHVLAWLTRSLDEARRGGGTYRVTASTLPRTDSPGAPSEGPR